MMDRANFDRLRLVQMKERRYDRDADNERLYRASQAKYVRALEGPSIWPTIGLCYAIGAVAMACAWVVLQ